MMWNIITICLVVNLFVGVAFAEDSVKRQSGDSVSACPVPACDGGLVMDRRGTVYTANRQSGEVVAVAQGEEPRLLAVIQGSITALAVDKKRAVYVGVEDGRVFRIAPDGRVDLIHRLDGVPVALNTDRDGGLVVVLDANRMKWVPFHSLAAEE